MVSLAFEEPPVVLPRELICCRIPLMDGEENSDAILRVAVGTVYQLLQEGLPTVVACSGGMSRSPAIAAAAISIWQQRTMSIVLQEITDGAPHDVSPGLWSHLSSLNLHI